MNEIRYDLIRAVREGRLKTVQDLVNQHGLSYAEEWADGYVLLRNSIEVNLTEIAKFLINSGAKVNSEKSETINSNTPLHFAVRNDNKELLEILLKRGANINAQGSEYRTPLFLATMQGNEETVEILLNSGASVCGDKSGTTPLHLASIRGSLNIAEKLLKQGSYVNSTCNFYNSSKGFTPLHFSVENNEEAIAELLLRHGANVDAGSQNMRTPLHIATRKGYVTIVEFLLRSGACVNAKTKEGLTPLHFASEKGNVELIKLLVLNNAEVDASANNKLTPLCFAIKGSHEKAAKFLLDHGANVDAEFENAQPVLSFAVERGLTILVDDILQHFPDKNNASNKNALKIAAKSLDENYFKIVEKLLKYGLSVEPDDINDTCLTENCIRMGNIKILEDLLKHGPNLSCKNGPYTLIHSAVKSRQTEVAKLLLNYGADVNAIDKAGNSPIFYSTHYSDVIMTKLLLLHGANIKNSPELIIVGTKKACKEMVELLIENQADIEATDKFGIRALHQTALSDHDGFLRSKLESNTDIMAKAEIADLLLSKGANVNAKTTTGSLTALHIACQKNFTNHVKVLLEYKADVNCIVKDLTALHIAAQKGRAQIAEMLLAYGANVNARRENGETSLHIAAKKGHLDVMKILLKNDADLESKDTNGGTPLHSAAAQDKYETVSLLLEHGALIDAQNKDGKTALHIASQLGKSRLVKLLLKLGSDINILTNNNCTPTDLANQSYTFKMFGIDVSVSEVEHIEYNKVSEILKTHLDLLKIANLFINEKYSLYLSAVPHNMKTAFNEKCKEEIERMKEEQLGSTKVSFYDILTKNISSLVKYARNEDIRQTIDCNTYMFDFPNYANIIKRNFKRGVQRCRLLDRAQELLTRYFELPYHCSDEILSYLSDDDLRNITKL